MLHLLLDRHQQAVVTFISYKSDSVPVLRSQIAAGRTKTERSAGPELSWLISPQVNPNLIRLSQENIGNSQCTLYLYIPPTSRRQPQSINGYRSVLSLLPTQTLTKNKDGWDVGKTYLSSPKEQQQKSVWNNNVLGWCFLWINVLVTRLPSVPLLDD